MRKLLCHILKLPVRLLVLALSLLFNSVFSLVAMLILHDNLLKFAEISHREHIDRLNRYTGKKFFWE